VSHRDGVRRQDIWLIRSTDPDDRQRRCFGFIETERSWQNHFDGIEDEVLKVRTDKFAAAERAEFDKHRAQFQKRLELITDLPKDQRQRHRAPLGPRWRAVHRP
jgi:hypothetical protein